jgi:hypothetical protein
MAQPTQNKAPVTTANVADNFAAPEGWENEQIGFPPYWNPTMKEDDHGKTIPGTGNAFLAIPIDTDERNPEFKRYVLEAVRPITCRKGPADDAEEILVQQGEFFTCSVYAALPLEQYYGIPVFVQPVRKRKLPPSQEVNQKRDLWDFSLKVSPADKKKLKERRTEELALLREKQARYRQEQIEKDASNPL